MYSTITPKKCKCGCAKNFTIQYGGYNYACAPESIKQKVGTKRQAQQKRKNARLYASAKARSLPENKSMVEKKYKNVQSNELKLWFSFRMNNCLPICENCGATNIYLKNKGYEMRWKSCQAHLLPKKNFKSIEAHPLNGMVLGAGFSGLCYCHDDYDHDWERAIGMNIWTKVVQNFEVLYPLILPEEHKHIPQILLDTL